MFPSSESIRYVAGVKDRTCAISPQQQKPQGLRYHVKFRSQLLTFFRWQTWAKHEVWQPDLSWNFCLCWIGVLPIWKCSLVFFRCHFGVKQETQTKGFLFPSFTSALKRWKGPDPSLLNCGDLGSFKTKSNSFQNEFLLICEAFTWLKTCALKCKDVEQRSVWFLLSLPN